MGQSVLQRREVFVLHLRRLQHSEQSVKKEESIIAAVKSKGHFIEVSGQVFRRDFMPRSDNPALQFLAAPTISTKLDLPQNQIPQT